MSKIILIRHGESVDNANRIIQHDNSPLTPKGRTQALQMGKELASNKNIIKIITSTTKRAAETAEIIGKNLKLKSEIQYEKGLASSDSGTITGKSIDEIKPLSPIEYAEKHKTGESRGVIFERINKSWGDIKTYAKTLNENEEIVLVAHRSTLSMIESIESGGGMNGGVEARKKNSKKDHGFWGIIVI